MGVAFVTWKSCITKNTKIATSTTVPATCLVLKFALQSSLSLYMSTKIQTAAKRAETTSLTTNSLTSLFSDFVSSILGRKGWKVELGLTNT